MHLNCDGYKLGKSLDTFPTSPFPQFPINLEYQYYFQGQLISTIVVSTVSKVGKLLPTTSLHHSKVQGKLGKLVMIND